MHFARGALLYVPMVSRSENYVEYCRETARHLHNIQDLALRGKNKQDITRRIQERIVREVELRPDDDVLDIGCGDGTLLQMAKTRGAHSAIGLLATEEEAAIVRRLGVEVRQGFTDQLPVPDQSASVVVCNSVLLVVPREKIPASLREICRVAKPGARVFLGEIPFEPGPPPEPDFPTARETLSYLYRAHGFRAWFGMLRRMAYWKLTGQPLVIRSGITIAFFAEPSEFAAMAVEAGLELLRCWQHDYPTNRYNYLFRKSAAHSASATSATAEGTNPTEQSPPAA
jgi:ubiquinone/menaquinone biosynthesis C-methylase UbiE